MDDAEDVYALRLSGLDAGAPFAIATSSSRERLPALAHSGDTVQLVYVRTDVYIATSAARVVLREWADACDSGFCAVGFPDAGSDAGVVTDAGTTTDGGSTTGDGGPAMTGNYRVTCGCSSAGAGSLGILTVIRRRRNRAISLATSRPVR